MTQRVRKAVFPVAGLGTRLLPATKTIPKEMVTIVDRPLIQYAVDEAREAGIEQLIFVTGRGKAALVDYFDVDFELEATLRDKGKSLDVLVPSRAAFGEVITVRQQQPLGLGHAVWCARHVVGDDPFAVLLPDDLMVGKPGALSQMIASYNQVGGGIIVAAEEKPKNEIKRYGVVDPGQVKGNATEVKGVVEKPATGTEPSNLCIIGRYILQPEIFGILDRQERGTGNEIQLTDAMAQMIGKAPFHAVKTDCARYDCGDKVGFLHANLAVGLSRPDIAPQLNAILKALV